MHRLSVLNNSLLTSTNCYFDVKLFYETASTKLLLNQASAGHRPASAWFLVITFIPPVYVYVCVCVSTPEDINNYWRDFDFK